MLVGSGFFHLSQDGLERMGDRGRTSYEAWCCFYLAWYHKDGAGVSGGVTLVNKEKVCLKGRAREVGRVRGGRSSESYNRGGDEDPAGSSEASLRLVRSKPFGTFSPFSSGFCIRGGAGAGGSRKDGGLWACESRQGIEAFI